MKTILDIGVFCVNVLTMAAVGMGLEARHFGAVAQQKGVLLLTLAAQALALPMVGWALTRMMGFSEHISAGILLLAACPVGNIANFYALLARANVPLSVTVNALSIVFSVGTMAFAFEMYDHLLGERFTLAIPTPYLVLQVLLMLVLPVLAGMVLRRIAPGFVKRRAQPVNRAGLAGLALLLVYVLAAQREQLAAEWQQTAVASAVFMLLALLGGLVFGRLLRLPPGDGLTVGIGFAVRNVALALAIAITLLNRLEYSVFAVVYFLTEVPLLLGVVAVYRWQGALAGQRANFSGDAR
jgi:BASS family bile acid:Na+ symporter